MEPPLTFDENNTASCRESCSSLRLAGALGDSRCSVAVFASNFLPAEPGRAVWERSGGVVRPGGVYSTILTAPR